MRNVGWNILVLSFALLASAEVPKTCSTPPQYQHTTLLRKYASILKFLSGDKVYYDCAEDFTPSRGSRAVQCAGGKWTKLSLKCEKKSCGNAGDLPNGEFHYEGNSFLEERVYALCNDGYTLKGLNYMICKKSGWTGEFPSCEEGAATCSTPAVANSVSSAGNAPVYRVGDHVNFNCSQGFQLDGARQITCGPGGLWQPQPPRCLPSPEGTESPNKERRCSVPVTPHNSNANLANKYITMTSFASGDKVRYTCDVGYISEGGSKLRRCIKGNWTPLLLKCERKPCGSAGEIINGEFIYTGLVFGDTATAVCNEGHRLVGKATRNCMSGGWDGRIPACEAVVCAEPVTNAAMSYFQEPPYTYRTVIHYRCPKKTLVGQRHIWCTENGTWSDPPPTCKEITCPFPNVPNIYRTGAWDDLYQVGDTIEIECSRGYTKTSSGIVTCGSDGRWSPDLPECRGRPINWRRQYIN